MIEVVVATAMITIVMLGLMQGMKAADLSSRGLQEREEFGRRANRVTQILSFGELCSNQTNLKQVFEGIISRGDLPTADDLNDPEKVFDPKTHPFFTRVHPELIFKQRKTTDGFLSEYLIGLADPRHIEPGLVFHSPVGGVGMSGFQFVESISLAGDDSTGTTYLTTFGILGERTGTVYLKTSVGGDITTGRRGLGAQRFRSVQAPFTFKVSKSPTRELIACSTTAGASGGSELPECEDDGDPDAPKQILVWDREEGEWVCGVSEVDEMAAGIPVCSSGACPGYGT